MAWKPATYYCSCERVEWKLDRTCESQFPREIQSPQHCTRFVSRYWYTVFVGQKERVVVGEETSQDDGCMTVRGSMWGRHTTRDCILWFTCMPPPYIPHSTSHESQHNGLRSCNAHGEAISSQRAPHAAPALSPDECCARI